MIHNLLHISNASNNLFIKPQITLHNIFRILQDTSLLHAAIGNDLQYFFFIVLLETDNITFPILWQCLIAPLLCHRKHPKTCFDFHKAISYNAYPLVSGILLLFYYSLMKSLGIITLCIQIKILASHNIYIYILFFSKGNNIVRFSRTQQDLLSNQSLYRRAYYPKMLRQLQLSNPIEKPWEIRLIKESIKGRYLSLLTAHQVQIQSLSSMWQNGRLLRVYPFT